ncbi:MAG: type VI secretion system tip protein VgrG [Desulfovibrio sp.]|nr:type VI secretion system tip protein VgrG [Desulfovibrio sp.]
MPERNLTELFHFTSDAFPEESFHVTHFTGEEGLNTLFRFTIEFVSENHSLDVTRFLDAPASFVIRRDNGDDAVFRGVPTGLEQGGLFNGYAYYSVELRPCFWKFTQIPQTAIFLDKTCQQVADELLLSQPFFPIPHEFRLTASYPAPEFAMQYGESIYDYILWRMEEQGAYFYFAPDGDTVVFADAPESHDAASITVYYAPPSGLDAERREEVLTSFVLKQTPLPARVVVRGFDWKNPERPVMGIARVSAGGMGDVYLANEGVESDAEAGRIAKIRAEERICQSRVFKGAGGVPTLRPGVLFTLRDHYSESFNRDYLVTEITHEGAQETFLSMGLGIPLRESRDHLFYRNHFSCIESDIRFRPRRQAPRARISGVIRAFVDGAGSGSRAEMDEYGRYKLVFPFDISGRKNGNASCWIRMSQPQVGKDIGMSFPLLPGVEVTVAFLDGNPDRPVITGALPNGETGALTGQGNLNFSGIRTAGGNQITFNDTDKNQGLSFAAASGLGLTMSDEGGSNTSSLTADNVVTTCGATALEYSLFCKNLFSGYKLSSVAAKNRSAAVVCSMLFNSVLGGAANALDTLSSHAANNKKEDLANALGWAASGTKLTTEICAMICDIVAGVQKGRSEYGITLNTAPNVSSTCIQVKPRTSMLITQCVAWALLRLSSVALDGAHAGITISDAKDKHDDNTEVYNTYSDTSMTVAQVLAENEAEMAEATAAYENSDKGEAATKAYEDAKKKYDKTRNAFEGADRNQTVDEVKTDEKKSFGYTKQNAIRKYVVNNLSDFLPDITAFITMLIGRAKVDDLGGLLLKADTKNINMSAGRTISAHSQQGIFLHTDAGPTDYSSWGREDKDLSNDGYKISDAKTEKTPFVAVKTTELYTEANSIESNAATTETHIAQELKMGTSSFKEALHVTGGKSSLNADKTGLVKLAIKDGNDSLPTVTLTGDAVTLTAKDQGLGLHIKDKEISLKTHNDTQIGMSDTTVAVKAGNSVGVSGKEISLAADTVKVGDFTFKGSSLKCDSVMELGGSIKITGSAVPGADTKSLNQLLSDINSDIAEQKKAIEKLENEAKIKSDKVDQQQQMTSQTEGKKSDVVQKTEKLVQDNT